MRAVLKAKQLPVPWLMLRPHTFLDASSTAILLETDARF